MASLDEVLSKVPKPILVFSVMLIAIVVIMQMNPLKDGCDVAVANFTEDVRGYLLKAPRTKTKKMILPRVSESKKFCKEGNSPGACENYFAALKKVEDTFLRFDNKCLVQLVEDENYNNQASGEASNTIKFELKEAIKISALLAWGEKPPAGLAERAGWLDRSQLYTFCRLKTVLLDIIGDEEYKSFRTSVLREFPDAWPEKLQNQINAEDVQRPTVLKWSGNPSGTMTEKEVIQRSLFSLKCDQYQ